MHKKQCKIKDIGNCCKEKDGFYCSRKEVHKGRHHAHSEDECYLKW